MHGLEDVLSELDTGVSKGDAFEIDELALLQLHVYNWPLVAHDYNLSVLILLLDGDTWLRDGPLTRVDTLSQSDDGILLCNLESLFERLDGPLL